MTVDPITTQPFGHPSRVRPGPDVKIINHDQTSPVPDEEQPPEPERESAGPRRKAAPPPPSGRRPAGMVGSAVGLRISCRGRYARSNGAATKPDEATRATTRRPDCSVATACCARLCGGRGGGDPSMACKGSGVDRSPWTPAGPTGYSCRYTTTPATSSPSPPRNPNAAGTTQAKGVSTWACSGWSGW